MFVQESLEFSLFKLTRTLGICHRVAIIATMTIGVSFVDYVAQSYLGSRYVWEEFVLFCGWYVCNFEIRYSVTMHAYWITWSERFLFQEVLCSGKASALRHYYDLMRLWQQMMTILLFQWKGWTHSWLSDFGRRGGTCTCAVFRPQMHPKTVDDVSRVLRCYRWGFTGPWICSLRCHSGAPQGQPEVQLSG